MACWIGGVNIWLIEKLLFFGVLLFVMIKKEICTSCNSNNIVMNGLTSGNRQKFHCKDCGCYRTLKTTQYYDEDRKEEILRAYKERSSLRGVKRVYNVSIPSVLRWLKKKSPNWDHFFNLLLLQKPMILWSLMNYGLLCSRKHIGYGFG